MRCLPLLLLLLVLLNHCAKPETGPDRIRVVFDTDTNNELDDQHALAYLLFNGQTFDVTGVTVNATRAGGNINKQYEEARRVSGLCGFANLPIFKGANGNFDSLKSHLDGTSYDGVEAVNFLKDKARTPAREKLTVIAVGKLTTIALLLTKYPSLQDSIHLVWLGSNYPDPGEYNLDNDTISVNAVLKSNVLMDIVVVRYGKGDGSDVVRLTGDDVRKNMAGKGPVIESAIEGRHGGTFKTFGDYSVSLFENIHYSGNPPSRALYDMVAVAIVKNRTWGKSRIVSAPLLINNQWVERSGNSRKVTIWGDFDKEKIVKDFYSVMDKPVAANIVE